MEDSTTLRYRLRHSAARGAAWLFGAALFVTMPAFAQEEAIPSSSPAADAAPYTPEELEDLVGRIALYPDDLIAIILPASTYPLQVVEAARFEERHKSDSSLEPDESWDDSVVALLNYPEVLRLMNEDLEWTGKLGDAVANQQADVFDAIQSFRDRALANGSLRSDEHQVVTKDEGEVEIKPADPEVVYVPYYEPQRVIVYGGPIYYYPFGYPLYYYPYPAGYSFSTGFFWGVTTAFVIGWHTHHIHVSPWTYVGHPYYGRHYYTPFYVRNAINVHVNVNLVHASRGGYLWRASPARRVHYLHHTRPAVRSYEGRYRGQFSTRSSGRLYDERRYTGTTSTREGHARGPSERIAPSYRSQGSTRPQGSTRSRGSTRPQGSTRSTTPAPRSIHTDRSNAASSSRTARSARAAPRTAPNARTAPSSRSTPSYRTTPSNRSAPTSRTRTTRSSRTAPSARPSSSSRTAPTYRSNAARSAPTHRSGATRAVQRRSTHTSRSSGSSRSAARNSGRGHYR